MNTAPFLAVLAMTLSTACKGAEDPGATPQTGKAEGTSAVAAGEAPAATGTAAVTAPRPQPRPAASPSGPPAPGATATATAAATGSATAPPATTGTASATPAGSASAGVGGRPIVCGSRHPPCPPGKKCSSERVGVCQ